MDDNEIFLSLDVVSLFTMIPIKEAIKVIEYLTNPETSKLVRLCLNSIFFSFKGELYEQTCGVAMGSPLSPIIANLFMETLSKNP